MSRTAVKSMIMTAALMLAGLAAPMAADTAATPSPALLDPSLAAARAPDVFNVKLTTTRGDVVLEVHRDWAPIGADRFYNLVKIGFYDGAKFYRVIRSPQPFMAQIGFNGTPAVDAAWRDAPIKDDPVKQSNIRGMVTFAKTNAPNSRTTQIFVNYGDNSFLDPMGFAPFAKVVDGMPAIDALYTDYGEGAPGGRGPSQGRIASEGNAYLERDFAKLDGIVSATISE